MSWCVQAYHKNQVRKYKILYKYILDNLFILDYYSIYLRVKKSISLEETTVFEEYFRLTSANV